jgi:hypothetical protein
MSNSDSALADGTPQDTKDSLDINDGPVQMQIIERTPRHVEMARHLVGLDLQQLPAEINKQVHDAEAMAAYAVEAAFNAGVLLNRAKTLVPHGQWEAWIAANCTFALRTAQAYMRLAAKLSALPIERRNGVAALPLREAFKAIGTPGHTSDAEARRDPYLRPKARSEGEKLHGKLISSATSIRKFARNVDANYIKRKDYERLRKELQTALDALDAFAEHCAGDKPFARIVIDADELQPCLDQLEAESQKNAAHVSPSSVATTLGRLTHKLSTEEASSLARSRRQYPHIADEITITIGGREHQADRSATAKACDELQQLAKARPDCFDFTGAQRALANLRTALGMPEAAQP